MSKISLHHSLYIPCPSHYSSPEGMTIIYNRYLQDSILLHNQIQQEQCFFGTLPQCARVMVTEEHGRNCMLERKNHKGKCRS
jgi:hypothetical protein